MFTTIACKRASYSLELIKDVRITQSVSLIAAYRKLTSKWVLFSPLHFDDIGDADYHFIPPHPAPLLYLCR